MGSTDCHAIPTTGGWECIPLHNDTVTKHVIVLGEPEKVARLSLVVKGHVFSVVVVFTNN